MQSSMSHAVATADEIECPAWKLRTAANAEGRQVLGRVAQGNAGD